MFAFNAAFTPRLLSVMPRAGAEKRCARELGEAVVANVQARRGSELQDPAWGPVTHFEGQFHSPAVSPRDRAITLLVGI